MGDMTRNVRTYDHFCLVARTLERVGDRWSLLVIRDLLTGTKRFTDLMDRLGGSTPKTPSAPLPAEHLLRAATQAIDLATDDHEPARWHFRLDGTDYLVESDGHQWTLTAKAPPAPADVTITATAESLATFIFARSDPGLDITGETGPVQRFRQLISTLATVVQ